MRHLHSVRPGILATALALIGAIDGVDRPAEAHLALIRQGAESRGSREPIDRMGHAVAAGDFNGDGFDDLASGAPWEDLAGVGFAGAVIVNWGTAYGLTHEGALLLTPESVGGVNEYGGMFGYALVAADFNGDGKDDLAIGQPGYDLSGSVTDVGKVWILGGQTNGFGSSVIIPRLQSDAGGVNETGDVFGWALAAGDFNDDGYADLAVGGPGEDNDAGAVFQFLGSPAGAIIDGGWFKQSTLGKTNDPGDRFGQSLAAGDLVGLGGNEELVVGAPYKTFGHVVEAGMIYILRGSSSGLTANSPLTADASVRDFRSPRARFGMAVACGRFWGGAYDGLAVGEPYVDLGGVVAAGRVLVAKGGFSGLDWTGEGLSLIQYDLEETVELHDNFGLGLAAGHFDAHTETYEDLFIGAPGEDDAAYDTGWIGIAYGGPNGPDGSAWAGFYQSTLNDAETGYEALGSAIACGRFDASGHGALAVGAPGDDDNAGAVHIIAPWRQAYNLSCKNAITYDCEGNRIYSLKPFEEVKIASTTKIMTVLIACERSQLPSGDPRHVPLTAEITVPGWVSWDVPGSRFEFLPQETITLEQLLYACLYPSGNDAAYAIAILLTGYNDGWNGITDTCTEFVDEMNDRAAALGMTRTHFTNPAGLDAGDPNSSADDMMTLSRVAMANPLFAEVASDGSFTWSRRWVDYDDTPRTSTHTQNYGWLGNLRTHVPDASGLKPGWTPGAQSTACMSVESPWGENSFAGMFGTPQGDSDYYPDARKLLTLGADECNWEILPGGIPSFRFFLPDLPTGTVHYTGGGSTIELDGDAVQMEIYRQTGQGTTAARLEAQHSVDAWFEGSETAIFGISPFEEHGEIVIRNSGQNAASIRVRRSVESAPLDLLLAPGERATIPPYVSATPLTGFTMSIENRTGDIAAMPVALTITETYAFELDAISQGSGPQFEAQLNTPSVAQVENLNVVVIGRDPNPGSTIYFAAREVGAPSSAEEPVVGTDGDHAVASLSIGPQPFTGHARLALDLTRPGDVELLFFDPQGRVVRRLTPGRLPAGRWEEPWDGRDAEGRDLPAGVYFYRVSVDGKQATGGRIVKIR